MSRWRRWTLELHTQERTGQGSNQEDVSRGSPGRALGNAGKSARCWQVSACPSFPTTWWRRYQERKLRPAEWLAPSPTSNEAGGRDSGQAGSGLAPDLYPTAGPHLDSRQDYHVSDARNGGAECREGTSSRQEFSWAHSEQAASGALFPLWQEYWPAGSVQGWHGHLTESPDRCPSHSNQVSQELKIEGGEIRSGGRRQGRSMIHQQSPVQQFLTTDLDVPLTCKRDLKWQKDRDPANFVMLGLQAKPNHLSSNKCEALSRGWAKGRHKQGKQAGQTCSLGHQISQTQK